MMSKQSWDISYGVRYSESQPSAAKVSLCKQPRRKANRAQSLVTNCVQAVVRRL
jgi:hypothetical protein